MGVPDASSPLGNEAAETTTSMLKNAETQQSETRPQAQNRSMIQEPIVDARELFANVKQVLVHRTYLSDADSAIVAYWVISTWFLNALLVNPCLVITGPAHEATILLRVLYDLCASPLLLAGVQRSCIKSIVHGSTLLISEPNLDSRTAVLLGNLTNRGFSLVEGRSWTPCAVSVAISIGENSIVREIQNSIWIDVAAPPTTKPRRSAMPVEQRTDPLRISLNGYRERNLEKVRRLEFTPSGLSLECHDIANALGSCIVDATDLQTQLLALLKPKNQQHLAERAESLEALIVRAALNLCQQGKDEVFVKEIASELNRLLEAHGETRRFSPEKVGHRLRNLGLLTRRLSQAGNGLQLDQETRHRLDDLAAVYMQEDLNEKIETCTSPSD